LREEAGVDAVITVTALHDFALAVMTRFESGNSLDREISRKTPEASLR
jgi:hypothetical protein